ncbi:MAG TPA: hypothetical protein VLB84_03265, partial [Bacteroidia bacterium]|nr:hypothetical protein [Bacteroidia bacterium]
MEKKKFIALLFLFIVIQGFSQSNKGKVMINGKGNFWTESSEEDSFYSNYLARNTSKNTSGMINLNVGYFVGNSFALGLSGTFEKVIQKSTTSNTIDTKSISDIVNQTFSIGIFGRYNYMIKESKFGIFLQLDN